MYRHNKGKDIISLTPLFTGNVDKDSSVIHEAAVVGSMRSWYAAIVRALGGYVCEKTSEDNDLDKSCNFTKQYKDEIKAMADDPFESALDKICPVCKLFGCTGWSRRFRITIKDLDPFPLFFVSNKDAYQSNAAWLWRVFGGKAFGGTRTGRGLDAKYTFKNSVLWPSAINDNKRIFNIKIVSLAPNAANYVEIAWNLLAFMSKYGAIGAKNQHGFGQIKMNDDKYIGADEECIKVVNDEISEYNRNFNADKSSDDAFNLKHAFSLTFQLKKGIGIYNNSKTIGDIPSNYNYEFIPCSFDVRYKSKAKNPFTNEGEDYGLRPHFKKFLDDKPTLEKLMGVADAKNNKDRSASKICVSHLWRENPNDTYKLKIWGYIPGNFSLKVDNVEAIIENFITANDDQDGMFSGAEVLNRLNRGLFNDKS